MRPRGSGAHSVTWLFVPGNRRDRFERAASSGADEIILDLEDAVSPDSTDSARQGVASWLDRGGEGWVRVNGVESTAHEHDLSAVRPRAGLRGVVVAKAEDPVRLHALRAQLPPGAGVVALIESALGIERATELARSGAVDRLAFGSIDFALDIGADETDEALLLARTSLVMASRLAGLPPPVDGVTTSTTDDAAVHDAATRSRALGFAGKLCVHPHQVEPVAAGFRPTPAQLRWASRVVEAAADHPSGTFAVDGQMIDRPVLLRARATIARGGEPG